MLFVPCLEKAKPWCSSARVGVGREDPSDGVREKLYDDELDDTLPVDEESFRKLSGRPSGEVPAIGPGLSV